ncbi:MAG: GLPGLI family protein, partial [Chitinophagaceae bacterium]
MKKTPIFIVFLLCSFALMAQNTENSCWKISYNYSHIKDTARPNIVYKENMVLLTNKEKSLYLSEYEFKIDSTFNDNMAKVKAGITIDLPNEPIKFKYHTFESLLFVQQESTLYSIKPWTGDKIVIEEIWPNTKWQLLDSTQIIGGLTCYSAIGVVKGRTYTVWYCPDYPVSAGPWKIRGLPGLIVAATDASKTISFQLQSINNISYPVGLPEKTTKLTLTEYEQLMDNFKKNPMGY